MRPQDCLCHAQVWMASVYHTRALCDAVAVQSRPHGGRYCDGGEGWYIKSSSRYHLVWDASTHVLASVCLFVCRNDHGTHVGTHVAYTVPTMAVDLGAFGVRDGSSSRVATRQLRCFCYVYCVCMAQWIV